MLKQRILTAIVLIAFLLLAIFYFSPTAFSVLTAGVLLLGAWEWSRLAQIVGLLPRIGFLVVTLVFMWIVSFLNPALVFMVTALAWVLIVYCLTNTELWLSIWSKYRLLQYGVGIGLLTTSWYAINDIHRQPHGAATLIFLLLIVWAADTGAYFAGRQWGKRKLAPHISPGKTVEGVLGGIVLAMVVSAIISPWLSNGVGCYVGLLALSLLTALISVAGDLFESLVKRYAGVKDSGGLLPGHGGVLDRIDSLLSAAPIFALGLWVLHRLC